MAFSTPDIGPRADSSNLVQQYGLDPSRFKMNADGTVGSVIDPRFQVRDTTMKIPASYFTSGMYAQDMKQYGQVMGPGGLFADAGNGTYDPQFAFHPDGTLNTDYMGYDPSSGQLIDATGNTDSGLRSAQWSAYQNLLNGKNSTTSFSNGAVPKSLGADVMNTLAMGGEWLPPGTDINGGSPLSATLSSFQGNPAIVVTDLNHGVLHYYDPQGNFIADQASVKDFGPLKGLAMVGASAVGMGALAAGLGAAGGAAAGEGAAGGAAAAGSAGASQAAIDAAGFGAGAGGAGITGADMAAGAGLGAGSTGAAFGGIGSGAAGGGFGFGTLGGLGIGGASTFGSAGVGGLLGANAALDAAGAAGASSVSGAGAGSAGSAGGSFLDSLGTKDLLGLGTSALGAIGGSQGTKATNTATAQLPGFLQGPVTQDLIPRTQGLLDSQMPQAQAAGQQLMTQGSGLLGAPVAGNGVGQVKLNAPTTNTNPYLSGMADDISRRSQMLLGQNNLQIQGNAVGVGGLGGSRQGVAQGGAAGQAADSLQGQLANLYGSAYNNDQNRALQQYGMDQGFYGQQRGQDLTGASIGAGMLSQGISMPFAPLKDAASIYQPFTGFGTTTGVQSAGGGALGALGGALGGAQLAKNLGLFGNSSGSSN